MSSIELDGRSRKLREDIIFMLECGGRGHIASALSLVEIIRVLYDSILSYKSAEPRWPDRDRLILSKGHGCMALFALLADKGYFPRKEFESYCKAESILGGHPEYPKVPGVEASTGALGHGLSIGVGFALNARYEKAAHRVFVILGDGECNEGSVWEAALSAGKHGLDNLTVIVDYNKMQSYASTFEVMNMEPFADKWRSFGFAVAEANGHSVEELTQTLHGIPFGKGKPSALICHTIKGGGIPGIEGDLSWHHKSRVSPENIESLYQLLRG
jgi:transketolase